MPYLVLGICVLLGLAVLSWQRFQTLYGAAAGLALAAGFVQIPVVSSTGAFLLAGLFILVSMGRGWHPLPVGATFGALALGFLWTPFATVGLAPFWLFALGSLFVAVTLLLPQGVVGTLEQWWADRQAASAANPELAKPDAAPAGAPEPSPRPAE